MQITILLATHSKLAGGMEKQVAQQAKLLNEHPDISITVVASPKLAHLFDSNVNFIAINMGKSRRNPILLHSIYNALKSSQPDICHAHGHKAIKMLASLKPFLPSKMKYAATSHGIKKNNEVLKKMDGVVAVSPSMQKHLQPIKSQYIPNGVSKCNLSNAISKNEIYSLFSLNIKQPIIMAVGRLAPVKRYDLLIKACNSLPVNLVIIGDGPELNKLKTIASNNICFAGHRSDVQKLMTGADLLVISSEREGFSLTLIEALLARLPVISSKVAGSVDILPNHALISQLDSTILKAKIEETLKAYDFFKNSFAHIFNQAEKELTIEANIENTLSFYQQIMQCSGQD